jgi:hypothetical protein
LNIITDKIKVPDEIEEINLPEKARNVLDLKNPCFHYTGKLKKKFFLNF